MSSDYEWLNLIEVSGPFLAVPVLREVFPQGLEALDAGRPQRLRRTYEEWREAVDTDDLDLHSLHAAWIDEVLVTALDMDNGVLRRHAGLPEHLTVSLPEHGVTVAPDLAVVNPTNGDEPLLLIHVYEPDTDLEATRRFAGLAITPADRMVALLRATGCPTGIVTNGERWMLVHAPIGVVAGFASWYSRLWAQEPDTLRAFVSLLGIRRFFGPAADQLSALYDRSLKHQDDVTEALGEQVRRAVEVLVQALDRADQDRNRDLLRDVDPRELYEAGLTVMMRLVFVLAAEERGLLLLGDPRYDSFYAISSLRMQLRADSEEILERRRSAWSRLLALFRGVYGGIDHPTLRLPALGGSLFDPDRYPFLEGRKKGTSWRREPAEPLPIDDRTVLLLLDAIQSFEGRTLSYRALDVEQIGHVYEGLLERTVQRVDNVTLELESSAKAKNARVALGEIESARLDGAARVVDLLKKRSERSEPAIRNAIGREPDERVAARLLTVCRGDVALRDRILPYTELLRTDPWGYPLVHHAGAFVVVLGADRRESGTHYTPKSLTEKIVEETLTPIVYRGPAEGAVRANWKLKSADELLDLKVCDPAMGSGAFLVQACRWLADRLVEAWSDVETAGGRIDDEGRICAADDSVGFEPLSRDTEERAILARRLIAERCLYGIDKNPLAVELAKLSLWLTTLAKGRPFGFLDHNLRSGDSLLGIHDLDQLIELDLKPKGKTQLRLFGRTIQSAVDKALALRSELRSIPIRDIGDVEAMSALDAQSRSELALPELIADALVGMVLAGERALSITALATKADEAAGGDADAQTRLLRQAMTDLVSDAPDGAPRRPLHWPLEFPEVFNRNPSGFDAMIGNPPFLGGKKITGHFGTIYRAFLVDILANGTRGNSDLVAYFLLRVIRLLRNAGTFGLITTNSIAEGDTRDVGLKQVTESGITFFSAIRSEAWAGTANVSTSRIHGYKGCWRGVVILDGKSVPLINDGLSSINNWNPVKLNANKGIAYQGSILLGLGFTMSQPKAEELAEKNPEFLWRVLFPYMSGKDLNSTPNFHTERWTICFWDWSKEQAEKYEELYKQVQLEVRPERDRQKKLAYRDRWWRYAELQAPIYKKTMRFPFSDISRQNDYVKHVICISTGATKYPCFAIVENKAIFANSLCVIVYNDAAMFACLSSDLHAVWAFEHGSRLEDRLRYTHGDVLETFPFPAAVQSGTAQHLTRVGSEYFKRRSLVMENLGIGMTEFYNRLHSPRNADPNIIALRALRVELSRQVASSYGFGNFDLEFGFHRVAYLPERDCVRFTISESARLEVLTRLSDLNRQRYQKEDEAGLHKATKKQAFGKKLTDQGDVDLFSADSAETEAVDD
jgi:hypothetical protein